MNISNMICYKLLIISMILKYVRTFNNVVVELVIHGSICADIADGKVIQ